MEATLAFVGVVVAMMGVTKVLMDAAAEITAIVLVVLVARLWWL
jgi:hypothetical protein